MSTEFTPNYSHLSEKVLEALEFAALAHKTQMRKGPQEVPYISHPAMVGTILARAGFSEQAIIAGVLHDVIEDTPFRYEDIEQRFGTEVADLVQHVSEDKTLPHLERKQLYLSNLETAPLDALAVSMADSMANLMSLSIGHHVYQLKVEGNYKNAVASLLKYGGLKIEIISRRLRHPLIEEWRAVHAKAVAAIGAIDGG